MITVCTTNNLSTFILMGSSLSLSKHLNPIRTLELKSRMLCHREEFVFCPAEIAVAECQSFSRTFLHMHPSGYKHSKHLKFHCGLCKTAMFANMWTRRVSCLSHLVTCAPCQCQRGQVCADPIRLRELLWLGEVLPANAGGGGLQPADVHLPLRQAELQPHVPQLAALG